MVVAEWMQVGGRLSWEIAASLCNREARIGVNNAVFVE